MVGEVDIITSTLGKALGGAAGGFWRDRNRLPTTHSALTAAAIQQCAPADRRASALAAVRHLERHPELAAR